MRDFIILLLEFNGKGMFEAARLRTAYMSNQCVHCSQIRVELTLKTSSQMTITVWSNFIAHATKISEVRLRMFLIIFLINLMNSFDSLRSFFDILQKPFVWKFNLFKMCITILLNVRQRIRKNFKSINLYVSQECPKKLWIFFNLRKQHEPVLILISSICVRYVTIHGWTWPVYRPHCC